MKHWAGSSDKFPVRSKHWNRSLWIVSKSETAPVGLVQQIQPNCNKPNRNRGLNRFSLTVNITRRYVFSLLYLVSSVQACTKKVLKIHQKKPSTASDVWTVWSARKTFELGNGYQGTVLLLHASTSAASWLRFQTTGARTLKWIVVGALPFVQQENLHKSNVFDCGELADKQRYSGCESHS